MKRTLSALSALLLLAAVAFAPAPAAAQDFTRFVVLGDSLTMGTEASCVVKYGQVDSWPAVVAKSAGIADFQQPLIDDPGLPGLGGCQVLTSLAPTFSYKASTGKPLNSGLARVYNNMGIDGFNTADVVDTVTGTKEVQNAVLRGKGTALAQVAAYSPTFVNVWLGAGDVLSALLSGIVVDGVTMTPRAVVKAKYETILKTLQTAQGGTSKGTVWTLPEANVLPFSSTYPIYNVTLGGTVVIHKSGPYAGTPWRWTGSRDGLEIPFGSVVLLTAGTVVAQGYGVACGMLDDAGYPATGPLRAVCGKLPLPEGKIDATGAKPGVVIYADNVAKIFARLNEYNTDFRALAATYGFKVFEAGALMADLYANGRKFGGMEIKTSYLSGGIYSYDGLHGSSLGYAVFADEYIQFLNAAYGWQLPRADLSVALLNGNSSGWFPLLQGPALTFEETVAFSKEYFNEEWMASLAASIPTVAGPGEIQAGDDAGPVNGARDASRSSNPRIY